MAGGGRIFGLDLYLDNRSHILLRADRAAESSTPPACIPSPLSSDVGPNHSSLSPRGHDRLCDLEKGRSSQKIN